jgi:hypothetical protein
MKLPIITLFALSLVGSLFCAPDRNKGISMHLLPERVARISGNLGGFTVNYAPHLAPGMEEPLLRSLEKFKAFVTKQKNEVKENGVWIVIQDAAINSELLRSSS